VKIIFEKLKTSNENIYVDFGDGVWKPYPVNEAKTKGIHIPESCTDYNNIKIKGSTNVFNNISVITNVNAGIPEEYLSGYVETDYGCGWKDPILKLSDDIDSEVKDRLYLDFSGTFYSLSELKDRIPYSELGLSDETTRVTYMDGLNCEVRNTETNEAYIMEYDTGSGYLQFGDISDFGSGLESFSAYMIENNTDHVIYEDGQFIVDFGYGGTRYQRNLYPVEDGITVWISFPFTSNTAIKPLGMDTYEIDCGSGNTEIIDLGSGLTDHLHLKENGDSFLIDTGYYKEHGYTITNDDNFSCYYTGPYSLDISDISLGYEHSLSDDDVYRKLCEKNIYLWDGYNYRLTNFKLK
jgi:hypothetical protein